MNVASVPLAQALADRVFPVPGGPYSKIPLGGSIPSCVNRSGWRSGSSRTSLSFSRPSLAPPTSSYVTLGLSSTVMRDTEASILGGRGILMEYLLRSTPTRIPSSISVGESFSSRATTNLAICLMETTYLASSESASIILVQRATCKGCSSCIICLSETRSQRLGGARPVSDSFTPASSFTRLSVVSTAFSASLMAKVYAPRP
mmetsp:Transcript_5762/g.11824  ORF Transcript_5762/g.11824 Transcript_5762/m.11824 type:complete len:203 (-) Transcript_5762:319-927(-)